MGAMAAVAVAVAAYALVGLPVRRPAPTPLDFRAIVSPSWVLFQVAVAVMMFAVLPPLPAIDPAGAWRGFAAGLAFVGAVHLPAILRGECVHQFEVRNLYSAGGVLRGEAAAGIAILAASASQEMVLRGVVRAPEWAVASIQFVLCLPSSRRAVAAVAVACAFVAGIHAATGSLGCAIGAHAGIQALAGWLRPPGIFAAVYPLLEQARWKNLGPAWHRWLAAAAAGGALIWTA